MTGRNFTFICWIEADFGDVYYLPFVNEFLYSIVTRRSFDGYASGLKIKDISDKTHS